MSNFSSQTMKSRIQRETDNTTMLNTLVQTTEEPKLKIEPAFNLADDHEVSHVQTKDVSRTVSSDGSKLASVIDSTSSVSSEKLEVQTKNASFAAIQSAKVPQSSLEPQICGGSISLTEENAEDTGQNITPATRSSMNQKATDQVCEVRPSAVDQENQTVNSQIVQNLHATDTCPVEYLSATSTSDNQPTVFSDISKVIKQYISSQSSFNNINTSRRDLLSKSTNYQADLASPEQCSEGYSISTTTHSDISPSGSAVSIQSCSVNLEESSGTLGSSHNQPDTDQIRSKSEKEGSTILPICDNNISVSHQDQMIQSHAVTPQVGEVVDLDTEDVDEYLLIKVDLSNHFVQFGLPIHNTEIVIHDSDTDDESVIEQTSEAKEQGLSSKTVSSSVSASLSSKDVGDKCKSPERDVCSNVVLSGIDSSELIGSLMMEVDEISSDTDTPYMEVDEIISDTDTPSNHFMNQSPEPYDCSTEETIAASTVGHQNVTISSICIVSDTIDSNDVAQKINSERNNLTAAVPQKPISLDSRLPDYKLLEPSNSSLLKQHQNDANCSTLVNKLNEERVVPEAGDTLLLENLQLKNNTENSSVFQPYNSVSRMKIGSFDRKNTHLSHASDHNQPERNEDPAKDINTLVYTESQIRYSEKASGKKPAELDEPPASRSSSCVGEETKKGDFESQTSKTAAVTLHSSTLLLESGHRNSNEEVMHECSKCQRMFSNGLELKKHETVCDFSKTPKSSNFKCLICGLVVTESSHLYHHMLNSPRCAQQISIYCCTCNNMFKTLADKRAHFSLSMRCWLKEVQLLEKIVRRNGNFGGYNDKNKINIRDANMTQQAAAVQFSSRPQNEQAAAVKFHVHPQNEIVALNTQVPPQDKQVSSPQNKRQSKIVGPACKENFETKKLFKLQFNGSKNCRKEAKQTMKDAKSLIVLKKQQRCIQQENREEKVEWAENQIEIVNERNIVQCTICKASFSSQGELVKHYKNKKKCAAHNDVIDNLPGSETLNISQNPVSVICKVCHLSFTDDFKLAEHLQLNPSCHHSEKVHADIELSSVNNETVKKYVKKIRSCKIATGITSSTRVIKKLCISEGKISLLQHPLGELNCKKKQSKNVADLTNSGVQNLNCTNEECLPLTLQQARLTTEVGKNREFNNSHALFKSNSTGLDNSNTMQVYMDNDGCRDGTEEKMSDLSDSDCDSDIEEDSSAIEESDVEYRCKLCSKTFHIRSQFVRHTKLHHPSSKRRSVHCKVCTRKFHDLTDLQAHLLQFQYCFIPLTRKLWENKQDPHLCTMCRRSLQSPKDLRKHCLKNMPCRLRYVNLVINNIKTKNSSKSLGLFSSESSETEVPSVKTPKVILKNNEDNSEVSSSVKDSDNPQNVNLPPNVGYDSAIPTPETLATSKKECLNCGKVFTDFLEHIFTHQACLNFYGIYKNRCPVSLPFCFQCKQRFDNITMLTKHACKGFVPYTNTCIVCELKFTSMMDLNAHMKTCKKVPAICSQAKNCLNETKTVVANPNSTRQHIQHVSVPVASTSKTNVSVPVPSTSKTNVSVPVASTSKTNVSVPVPSTSKTNVSVPVPSTSKTNVSVPVPSTSKTNVSVPVPRTSKTNVSVPVPSTSKTNGSVPVPSTSKIIHSTEELFPCKICDAKFPLLHLLMKHSYQHEEETPLTCDRCDSVFVRYNQFVSHQTFHIRMDKENGILSAKTQYNEMPPVLEKLDSSDTSSNQEGHNMSDHLSACLFCHQEFPNAVAKVDHISNTPACLGIMKYIIENKFFTKEPSDNLFDEVKTADPNCCEFCEHNFSDKLFHYLQSTCIYRLEKAILRFRAVSCPPESVVTTTAANKTANVAISSTTNNKSPLLKEHTFYCPICKQSFHDQNNLLIHQREQHGQLRDRKLPPEGPVMDTVDKSDTLFCFSCSKYLRSRTEIENHKSFPCKKVKVLPINIAVKTDMAQLMCTICNTKFTAKHNLMRHMIHKHCDEHANEIMIAAGQKASQCSTCSKNVLLSKWRSHFQQHKLIYLQEIKAMPLNENVICFVCKRQIVRSCILEHINKHTIANIFTVDSKSGTNVVSKRMSSEDPQTEVKQKKEKLETALEKTNNISSVRCKLCDKILQNCKIFRFHFKKSHVEYHPQNWRIWYSLVDPLEHTQSFVGINGGLSSLESNFEKANSNSKSIEDKTKSNTDCSKIEPSSDHKKSSFAKKIAQLRPIGSCKICQRSFINFPTFKFHLRTLHNRYSLEDEKTFFQEIVPLKKIESIDSHLFMLNFGQAGHRRMVDFDVQSDNLNHLALRNSSSPDSLHSTIYTSGDDDDSLDRVCLICRASFSDASLYHAHLETHNESVHIKDIEIIENFLDDDVEVKIESDC